MMDNLLIDLPEVRLPRDNAWEVQFVAAVGEHARRLGVTHRFHTPRFFGYYFSGPHPVVVAGPWTVMLDDVPLLDRLRRLIDQVTDGRFTITSATEGGVPEFLLVHDRHDGSCWLWDYHHGLRFLEADEPVAAQSAATDGDGDNRADRLDTPET